MTRRALTLVETLAATVLLAVLAGAAASLVRDARLSLEPRPAHAARTGELSLVADAIAASPTDFGLPARLHTISDPGTELSWPDRPDRPPIRLRVMHPSDDAPAERADHAWLVVECGGSACLRWLTVPAERASTPEARP